MTELNGDHDQPVPGDREIHRHLDAAREALGAGDLDRAEVACSAGLELEADFLPMLEVAGVVACQRGDLETGISDWLEIRQSGTYQLSARYTGLLDNQRPNVTPGWQLWRQSAVSKPVETTLLTAPDYVARRSDLARETGLALALTKNENWKPIEGTRLSLTIKNQGDKQRSIAWPSALGLWILDANGRRVQIGRAHV